MNTADTHTLASHLGHGKVIVTGPTVGAGSVVTKDVPPLTTVTGDPGHP